MSEEFHTHGHESHHIEHEAQQGIKLAQWVAILSALFACFAAMIGYQSADKENEAILLKNEAIIKTTQASDAWALYQAKKMKAHLLDIAQLVSHDQKQINSFQQVKARYQQEQLNAQQHAQVLEMQAKQTEQAANLLLKPHKRLAQAMTMLQIAISLASITALTRKKWLLFVSILAAIMGIALAGINIF